MIIRVQSDLLLDNDEDYTPDDLRAIADRMEKEGLVGVRIEAEEDYGCPTLVCKVSREETPAEAAKRQANAEHSRRLDVERRVSNFVWQSRLLGIPVDEAAIRETVERLSKEAKP